MWEVGLVLMDSCSCQVWWEIATVHLNQYRITMEEHFPLCLWGCFQIGLPEEGRAVLNAGSDRDGTGPRPEHKGGNEQGINNHFSLLHQGGCSATAVLPSCYHDSPSMLECTLNLWATRNPSFLSCFLLDILSQEGEWLLNKQDDLAWFPICESYMFSCLMALSWCNTKTFARCHHTPLRFPTLGVVSQMSAFINFQVCGFFFSNNVKWTKTAFEPIRTLRAQWKLVSVINECLSLGRGLCHAQAWGPKLGALAHT